PNAPVKESKKTRKEFIRTKDRPSPCLFPEKTLPANPGLPDPYRLRLFVKVEYHKIRPFPHRQTFLASRNPPHPCRIPRRHRQGLGQRQPRNPHQILHAPVHL